MTPAEEIVFKLTLRAVSRQISSAEEQLLKMSTNIDTGGLEQTLKGTQTTVTNLINFIEKGTIREEPL